MSTTNPIVEKRTAEESCKHDWCAGPTGDQLPCFACFSVRSTEEEDGR